MPQSHHPQPSKWWTRPPQTFVDRALAEAVERTHPAYVLHGHWHQPNHARIRGTTEVFGLNADGSHNSTALLTTRPALHVTYTTAWT